MSEFDREKRETEIDELCPQDEDTNPGLEPPPHFVGSPPSRIPGVSDGLNLLLDEIRKERRMMQQLVVRIETAARVIESLDRTLQHESRIASNESRLGIVESVLRANGLMPP